MSPMTIAKNPDGRPFAISKLSVPGSSHPADSFSAAGVAIALAAEANLPATEATLSATGAETALAARAIEATTKSLPFNNTTV